MAKNGILSNLVEQKALRKVQLDVLEKISKVISKTAGPFGSYSMLMHQGQLTEYSKDGHKVLSNFRFYKPLEQAVHDELLGITEHVIKKVGDGTTSAVQLSYLIYKGLCDKTEEWTETGYTPYDIISAFQAVVNKLSEIIKTDYTREMTIEDIEQICLISTNGNKTVSGDIADIYEKFGKDVFIKIGTSNTESSITKEYNGIILNKGYSSPSFINDSQNNTCTIHQPRIYYFPDPVDTPEMIQLFFSIFTANIFEPYRTNSVDKYKPTVIIAPSVSQDMTKELQDIEKIFYAYEKANQAENKPPFCIITGINDRVDNIGDIVTLCGCPQIRKYINPDQRKADIEKGIAPDMNTVMEFYGSAEKVVISLDSCTITNPKDMYDNDAEPLEDGSRPYSGTYTALINFLKSQIEIESQDKNNIELLTILKKRLHSLTANFVEYNIGGVSAADRDNVRDLVEDAVLNCRSAAINGVSQGAGIAAKCAVHDCIDQLDDLLYLDMLEVLNNAYSDMILNLYSSGMSVDRARELMESSVKKKQAYNLREKSFNTNQVLCSGETDIAILEAISKIITIMYTTNQAFLVDPMQNGYIDDDED